MMLFENDSTQNLLPDTLSELYYFSNAIAEQRSRELFQIFKDSIAWKSESIILYGKEVMQPRLTAWYGNPEAVYTYSGRTNQPLAFTKELLELKLIAERYAGTEFNSVLLNYYRNGNDSMGFHRDNEKELGIKPTIVSISLGAVRDFVVRPYKKLQLRISLALDSGSLMLMKGEMQNKWEHALPKRSNVKDARINLTFRKII